MDAWQGLSLGRVSNGNLVWETVCQVGDVVLVHDESALDFAPQDEAVGFIDLMGCSVRTSRGEQLGKVSHHAFGNLQPSLEDACSPEGHRLEGLHHPTATQRGGMIRDHNSLPHT